MYDYLDKLNEEQKKAVLDTEGAVLVLAGAGSGKTRVLTSRIAYIIDKLGVLPQSVLAITFTNKAAGEMKERLSLMVDGAEYIWCSTIHSMCVRILRSTIDRLGYSLNFTIYDEVDKENHIKRIIKRDFHDSEEGTLRKKAKDAADFISNAKSNGITCDQIRYKTVRLYNGDKYLPIYETYEREMQSSSCLDFDDLLWKTCEVLERFDDVREHYAEKFKYIHIDEFQDINAVQYRIVKMLASVHGNIFAVGDDDQSIYGWRGAEIKTILNFHKDFKGTKIYKLEQNYRSTKKILDLANTVIKDNVERADKELWTENPDGASIESFEAENGNGEAFFVAKTIKSLSYYGYAYSDFAVLMRMNALSRSFEQSFLEYGIPYKVYGGFKFFERKEIKDLLAYFKVLINPLDNESILRIINVPKRGIGDKSIEFLVQYAADNKVSIYESLSDVEDFPLSKGAKDRLKEFRKLISSLMIDREICDVVELYDRVLEKTNYMSLFSDDTDEADSKKMNVGELKNSVVEFVKQNENATLADYLNSVTLSSDTDEINNGDFVTIATVHAVKGLEYKVVFVVGMDEGLFPSSRTVEEGNVEEERRLFYVAITRAEERLYITRAKERRLYGKESQFMSRSQFLSKIASKIGLPEKGSRSAYGYKSNSYGGFGNGYNSYGNNRYGSGGYQNNYQNKYQNGSNGGYQNSYQKSNYYKRNDDFGDDFGDEYPTYASNSNNFDKGASKSKSALGGVGLGFSSLNANKPKAAKSDVYTGYKTGMKVIHDKFGEGIVITVKGEGENLIVDVAFKSVGIKSLSAKFAPMKPVQ